MTSVTAWNSIDGLPKQFVSSLKVLFDILDEGSRGYVKFTDIEARWHEEGVRGLPSGVTEALRKVTPPNGYLSFERFVAGLKLALLTSQRLPREPNDDKENSQPVKTVNTKLVNKPVAAPRDAVLTKSSSHHVLNRMTPSASNTAAVRPNNALSSNNRDRSNNDQKVYRRTETPRQNSSNYAPNHMPPKRPVPPPRPQKPSHSSTNSDGQIPPKVPPRDKSKNIITELKNWQRRMNHQSSDQNQSTKSLLSTKSDSNLLDRNVDRGRQNDIYENIEQVRLMRQEVIPATSTPTSPPQQRQITVKRRDSARRHTLANGVDYNMIKRMKQLEQEKGNLLKGLEMVEQAQEWYHKQVIGVEEKQKYIGQTSYNDYSLEANQERMNFQNARIMEVNQQLKTLIESSERGFPLHMNLAVGRSNAQFGDAKSIKILQENEKQLKKELYEKMDKITQLEKEKASLIRDLFEARSKGKNCDDTTFM